MTERERLLLKYLHLLIDDLGGEMSCTEGRFNETPTGHIHITEHNGEVSIYTCDGEDCEDE